MAPLTEEQRERIRKNRERALEIQRQRRKLEAEEQQRSKAPAMVKGTPKTDGDGDCIGNNDDDGGKGCGGKKRKATADNDDGTGGGGGGGGVTPSSICKKAKKKKKKSMEGATAEAGAASLLEKSDDTSLPIEPFEEGASEWVTKKEAMTAYCLPEGTLAVLHVEERDNPHNKLWKPMKLYRRIEVRAWAHRRFGGLVWLQTERERRRQRKLEKDMREADNVFK